MIAILLGMKRYVQAVPFVEGLLKAAVKPDEIKYYSCLKSFLTLIMNGFTNEESSGAVTLFYGKNIFDLMMNDWFLQNPVARLIKNSIKPDPDLVQKTNAIHKKVKDLQKKDPINQLNLKNLFVSGFTP